MHKNEPAANSLPGVGLTQSGCNVGRLFGATKGIKDCEQFSVPVLKMRSIVC
jgi:hypothetical protein